MTKLIHNYVIFAIDDGHDLYTAYRFMKLLNELQAMMKLNSKPQLCIGQWEGQLENAYCMDYNDFYEHIVDSGFVDNRVCVLEVNPMNPRQIHRKQATLVYQDGKRICLGEFKKATPSQAVAKDADTYFTDSEEYWVA